MRNIILGVTASVAAIKTTLLAEALSKFANVKIVLTAKAQYFVDSQMADLQKMHIPVLRDADEWPAISGMYPLDQPILHIELRRWADCLLIAPLDANSMAKIVHGFSDNLLTSIVRAWDWKKPMFLCPAMNTMMWDNPPTAAHIAMLQQWGAAIIEPVEKKLACNDVGMGAMANVGDIARFVEEFY